MTMKVMKIWKALKEAQDLDLKVPVQALSLAPAPKTLPRKILPNLMVTKTVKTLRMTMTNSARVSVISPPPPKCNKN